MLVFFLWYSVFSYGFFKLRYKSHSFFCRVCCIAQLMSTINQQLIYGPDNQITGKRTLCCDSSMLNLIWVTVCFQNIFKQALFNFIKIFKVDPHQHVHVKSESRSPGVSLQFQQIRKGKINQVLISLFFILNSDTQCK
jgi:hypothetical protein